MDLRTKLVLALVAVSLASMAALGVFGFTSAEDLLAERTLRQLDALAEAKREDVETVVGGWEDRVALIASRTQLRLSLREIGEDGGAEERERIRRILADALAASAAVRAVAVYDRRGRSVASAGSVGDETGPPELPAGAARVSDLTYLGVSFDGDRPTVAFLAPLELEGRRVGHLRAVLGTGELLDVARNFTGLGRTGETIIAARDSAGRVRVLHPVRFAGDGVEGRAGGASDPVLRALEGEEGTFEGGLVDYRGERVWAATRSLPELGWGLVVKFDATEERTPIVEFRDRLLGVGFALSAFAILLGILLGLHIAGPIQGLAETANRLREGELDARAQVEAEDELGLLAVTFNEMAEAMERQVTALREYKTFFDVSPDMLCIAGTDGYFKRVNPAFERTLGWSEEELLGRPFVDFVHPDDVERTLRETENLARGIPTVSFENRYRRADGGYERLEWTCHPEPDTGRLYAVARTLAASGPADPAAGDAGPD